jgi:hypothetical protein
VTSLPAIGVFVWLIGLAVLIINTVGDSGTPRGPMWTYWAWA